MEVVNTQVQQLSLKMPASNGYSNSRENSHGGISPSTAASDRSSWPAGTEVIAEHSFPGGCSDDLSFQRNECLTIISATKDPYWYKARRKDGSSGMIPANYVRKRAEKMQFGHVPWFHGKISREDAEKFLAHKPDGTFLVRESTNFPGDYTLCVAHLSKVQHYRIQSANGKLTCDDEEYFESLSDLVAHYQQDADGLCHHLTSFVEPSGGSARSPNRSVASRIRDMDVWTILRSELQLGDAIGKGEFADVFVGRYKDQKVAVKVLKNSSQLANSLLTEASLMTSLRHPNLVRLLGVVLDDIHEIYMVTEFMPNGSLVEYLRTRGRLQVTKRQQINFACDVCAGMSYLESKNLVHRDLAARNVLLADDMTAKVSDFGLAKEQSSISEDSSGKFPIKWTAPEALKHSHFTSKSDVWSFGVLLWEIYSFGRVPYPRVPVLEVVHHIEKGYRMEAPDGCPEEVSDLMYKAWALQPQERPTFGVMLERLERIRSSILVTA